MTARREPVAPRLPAVLGAATRSFVDDEDLVEDVELRGDLTGATATDVTFSRTRLVGVRLTGAALTRLRVIDCVLDTCDLSGAFLEASSWQRVSFVGCRLSGAVLAGATLRHVELVDCRADGLTLRMAKTERVAVLRGDLSRADLYASQLADSTFDECNLTDAEISQATLTGARLRRCDIGGLKGVRALAGATIDSAMIVPVALDLFAAFGITVADADDD